MKDAFLHFSSQLLIDLWPFKLPASVAIGYYLEYIGASAQTLIALFALISVDLIFGVWLAAKRNEFSREKLFRWVLKVALYLLIICICGHTIQAFFEPLGLSFPLLNLLMAMMIITETKSIFITMERLELPVPAVAVWVIKALDKRAKREAEKFLNADEKGGEDECEWQGDSGELDNRRPSSGPV